ncbi:hypothetical protein OC835_002387 [Tilletia horrida]|nr:hypothetical protein OC835_002387 [Tilletia horrida]
MPAAQVRPLLERLMNYDHESFMEIDFEMTLEERLIYFWMWARRVTDYTIMRHVIPYWFYASVVGHVFYIGACEVVRAHRYTRRLRQECEADTHEQTSEQPPHQPQSQPPSGPTRHHPPQASAVLPTDAATSASARPLSRQAQQQPRQQSLQTGTCRPQIILREQYRSTSGRDANYLATMQQPLRQAVSTQNACLNVDETVDRRSSHSSPLTCFLFFSKKTRLPLSPVRTRSSVELEQRIGTPYQYPPNLSAREFVTYWRRGAQEQIHAQPADTVPTSTAPPPEAATEADSQRCAVVREGGSASATVDGIVTASQMETEVESETPLEEIIGHTTPARPRIDAKAVNVSAHSASTESDGSNSRSNSECSSGDVAAPRYTGPGINPYTGTIMRAPPGGYGARTPFNEAVMNVPIVVRAGGILSSTCAANRAATAARAQGSTTKTVSNGHAAPKITASAPPSSTSSASKRPRDEYYGVSDADSISDSGGTGAIKKSRSQAVKKGKRIENDARKEPVPGPSARPQRR